ncbi:MAG: excinuclease ABC subunit UvrC, partial [Longimicrobiaceae bacterium]
MPLNPTLEAKLRTLPTRPGVYLFRDAQGVIVYVGKAKSLRSRVRSYFAGGAQHGIKTQELVRRVADVDTIVVSTEAEALILENNLIKENKPRFNISLKDDKTYPYIKVTVHERFPRVWVTRRLVKDGSRYFGPYTDVRRMRQSLDLVKKLYTVRSCDYDLPRQGPARPCLDYHIGRCLAPCVAFQPEEDYRGMIDEILEVLGGHTRLVADRLKRDMQAAAAEMNFERAAELRDAIAQLDSLERRQRVVDVTGSDRDVVGFARDGAEACGVVMLIREGKLLGREVAFLSNAGDESDETAFCAFVTRHYTERAIRDDDSIPPEIFFPADFSDREVLQELLREHAGRAVRLHVPQRGEKVQLVTLAGQNARHLLEERRLMAQAGAGRAPDALYELQEVLELGNVPRTILCFDISHTQGSEVVASGVFFENGEPSKGEYKRFRIRGAWGNDDFASMHEVVSRWFNRRVQEQKPLPDLVVIDGGKGQLGSALKAMEEIGLPQQPVISLAKREEEVYVPGRSEPIRMPKRSSALRLLQRVRDEAHRFAIEHHRARRDKAMTTSILDEITGIGPARKRVLLRHFGSPEAVVSATREELEATPGLPGKVARELYAQLNKTGR